MTDRLIAEYLGRLDAAAWPLPPSRRSELNAEVSDHIETALSEAGNTDEPTVRNVLDRLGRPEDIVAAEMDASSGGWPPTGVPGGNPAQPSLFAQAAARGWGGVEIAAVLLLTAGALLLWFIGPIIGVVVAWFSERWTVREKRVATALILGSLVVELVLIGVFMSSAFGGFGGFGGSGFPFGGTSLGLLGLVALAAGLLPLLAGLGAGLYLALALRYRN